MPIKSESKKTEFPNVWENTKYHSNPYIHGTTVQCHSILLVPECTQLHALVAITNCTKLPHFECQDILHMSWPRALTVGCITSDIANGVMCCIAHKGLCILVIFLFDGYINWW